MLTEGTLFLAQVCSSTSLLEMQVSVMVITLRKVERFTWKTLLW